MSDTDHSEEAGRLVAAEYVLGVLAADERLSIERQLARDPVLAREVAFWEERLAPLTDAVPPVPPPALVWSHIEATLGPSGAPSPKPGVWENLALWRAIAAGTTTFAVACLAGMLYIGLLPPTERAPLIATINSSTGQPNFVATVTGGNSLTVVPAALLTNDPRAMELWLIVPGDRPRSLGLIEGGREVRINLPPDLAARVATDATLAVSLEPPGGSPTGAPTGPVIATGKLTSL